MNPRSSVLGPAESQIFSLLMEVDSWVGSYGRYGSVGVFLGAHVAVLRTCNRTPLVFERPEGGLSNNGGTS